MPPRDLAPSLNGATLYPLMAAAEQWPDPWFEPWKPAAPAR
ncbi:hypothetical protein OHS71_40925 [Streptomyces sp. NBC_00377]|nr:MULTISPECIES: hypothetical protein [unclassified Streptomyces]